MDDLIVMEISFDLTILRLFEKASFEEKKLLQISGICTYR